MSLNHQADESTGQEPVGDVVALVREGWRHLQFQRPVAAWASWQRALRSDPGCSAAAAALDRLAVAAPLPLSARSEHRFREPEGVERRARWDSAFRNQKLEELDSAAGAFRRLARQDATDTAARFNEALCLAWMGRNLDAIATLNQVVEADAVRNPDRAIEAWSLAEVLRQGGGAEVQADDLMHTLSLPWWSDTDPVVWLKSLGVLRTLTVPRDPLTGQVVDSSARVFEWLDRLLPEPRADLEIAALPRVWATVIVSPDLIRFSSPIPAFLCQVEKRITRALGPEDPSFDRSSTPLSFVLWDAAVWQFRLPEGLDEETQQRLRYKAVERYYETEWVDQPRHGLGGAPLSEAAALTPRDIANLIHSPDDSANHERRRAVGRAKLEAVIRVREELAARPHVAGLYAGYSFDDLRCRLGLEPTGRS